MAVVRAFQQPLRLATGMSALAGPSRAMAVPNVRSITSASWPRTTLRALRTSTTTTSPIRRAYTSSPVSQLHMSSTTRASSPSFESSTTNQSSSSSSSSSSNSSPDPEPEPKSAYARFKLLTKKYGWYALGMYTFLSTIDFSLSFMLVHALGVERIQPMFEAGVYQYNRLRHGADEAKRLRDEARVTAKKEREQAEREVKDGKKAGGYWGSRAFWAELVLAYGIHKTALLPFRAGLTVAWTPKVVGWLTARGWIGKGGFGRAATHAQGKIKDASERVKARTQRDKA